MSSKSKLKLVTEEFFAQIKDMQQNSVIYWILFGIIVYQFVAYFILSFVPYAPLKIFTWCFFMLIFMVLLLMIEEAITFTQAYHLLALIVVQIVMAFGVQLNPLFMAVIYEVLLRRFQQYVHANLSKDSLLPLISNEWNRSDSKNKENLIYDGCRLTIFLTLLMQVRDSFAPIFLAHFSAPWCFFTSEFPIFYVGLCCYIYNLKFEAKGVLTVMGSCLLYTLLFEPSNIVSIVWHFAMSSCFMLGMKTQTMLTIILSSYGGITYFIFSYFPSIQYCTTMYVFMSNLTFLASLCLTWLLHPPEILLYKPKYFPRMFYMVLAQFVVMTLSFLFELTVENPYERNQVYLEGMSFIIFCLLYFLLMFFFVYYFSYGWLYRTYFVETIAVALKKRNKSAADEEEIARAVGREVDMGLRDEIDDRMGNIDMTFYGDEAEEDADQPFQLSNISAEDLYFRLVKYLDKNFGELSLKLYKNYYTDSISSMLNPTVIIIILLLNFLASKFSIFIYYLTAIFALNFDNHFKTWVFKFFGKINVKLFMYKNGYSLLEENPKPVGMTKEDYMDYTKLDMFSKHGAMYLTTCFFSFVYYILSRLAFYKIYEFALKLFIMVFHVIGLELHFLWFIYYEMVDDTPEMISMTDLCLLIFVAIPLFMMLLEFLTVPAHIKWLEYEGKAIMFYAPSVLLIFFLYESEWMLGIAITEVFFMCFVLWYVTEQEDHKTDARMTQKHGRSWEKYKQEQDKSVTAQMMASLSSPMTGLAGLGQ